MGLLSLSNVTLNIAGWFYSTMCWQAKRWHYYNSVLAITIDLFYDQWETAKPLIYDVMQHVCIIDEQKVKMKI